MPTHEPGAMIDHFVSLVLGHIDREYPNKLDHVINDPTEVRSPRSLHPVFYGSFDWHSCVHGHWLLVRALRLFPGVSQRAEIICVLDQHLTPENVAGEVAYLNQSLRTTFERTYGWAWLLKLAAELELMATAPQTHSNEYFALDAAIRWRDALAPLTGVFVDRFLAYLPKATYPIRTGVHPNSAFALALANDFARATAHDALGSMIERKARDWFLNDRDYQGWEPGGADFLSPGLMEGECMRRILPEDEFHAWFAEFMPRLSEREPAAMFKPAFVSDRTDGQITHLDGLNLSRAWCLRSLGATFPHDSPARRTCLQSYREHLEAALPHVSGDYMGEHWLATFALLAMTE